VGERRNRGQVLVVTSLVVVILLLSTVIYVLETEKDAPVYQPDSDIGTTAIEQAATHAVISALANVSNGGNPTILAADLSAFKSAVESRSLAATVNLEFSTSNNAPYAGGFWFSWGIEGTGVSSSAVAFSLNKTGSSSNCYSQFSVNLTSSLSVGGYVSPINESASWVNLTCIVLNEGNPAQTGTLTAYYQQDSTAWVQADSPTALDFGNSTCRFTFAAINATANPLPISVNCIDVRGISVWANATCPLL
jgi:hypothetical protein